MDCSSAYRTDALVLSRAVTRSNSTESHRILPPLASLIKLGGSGVVALTEPTGIGISRVPSIGGQEAVRKVYSCSGFCPCFDLLLLSDPIGCVT